MNYFPKGTLDGCQGTTRYQYTRMITRFDEYLDKPIYQATVEDFDTWVDFTGWGSPTPSNPNPSNETKKLALNAIKAYLRETLGLKDHPLLDHTFKHRAGQRRKALSLSEKEAALAEVARMTRPRILVARNTAFMECLWSTMVRRHELANLLMENVDLDRGFITVWAKASSRRGKRQQLKKLSPESIQALKAWLDIRPQFANGCPYCFVTRDGKQWVSNSVSSFFKRLNKRLSFSIYPHAYRGGGATHAIERGIPDRLVMRQGGWESWQVFKRYTEQVSLDRYGEMMWGGEHAQC
jgi:integrase